MPTAIPGAAATTTVGLVGSMTGTQEVANPGLKRMRALQEAKAQLSLKAEVEKLTTQVADLESKLSLAATAEPAGSEAAADAATAAAQPTINELMASLAALTATAAGETGASSAVIGGGGRPSTAPYRRLKAVDSQSVVSWSVDAFGKSKTPGWYHQYRHELYREKASRAAAAPDGCYISHSKYADEAVRIKDTGRLAFSAGK